MTPLNGSTESPATRRTTRLFLALFGAAVVLFVAADAYMRGVSARIADAAADIAGNAAPSIERLSAARADLHELLLQLDAHDPAAAAPVAGARPAVDRARLRFDADVREYLELPAYPHERARWEQVARGLAQLDGLIDDALAHGPSPALGARLRPVAEQVSAAMLAVTELNAEHAQADADGIAHTRRRIVHASLALNGLFVALAVVAAAAVLRAGAQQERLERAHREVRDARARELEGFAERVAHDIRSPLATLGLALSVVERRAPPEASLADGIRRARRGLERVVRIVDALFEFARAGAQPGQPVDADLRAVLDDVLEDVAAEAAAARTTVRVEGLAAARVACASGALTSVFANLVRNAIKYMGDAPERVVTLRARREGSAVLVEVEDTGPGVPAALREAIFQPYVRAAGAGQVGAGLGLATVRRICEAHGGSVGVRAGTPRGSVFWFRLPLVAPAVFTQT